MDLSRTFPAYDGTESFAIWRKKVERLSDALILTKVHAQTAKTFADAEMMVLADLYLSIQGPAQARVDEIKEAKLSAFSAACVALEPSDKAKPQDYISKWLNIVQAKFTDLDSSNMANRVNSWPTVPRDTMYAEIPVAVQVLGENAVWAALTAIMHPSLKNALASANTKNLNPEGFVLWMKEMDEKLSKIARNPAGPVPISMTLEDFYAPKVAPPSTVQAIAKDKNDKSNRHQQRLGKRREKDASSSSAEAPTCAFCRLRGHKKEACWANPEGNSYRPEFVRRAVQSARARKSAAHSRSMFSMSNVDDAQSSDEEYSQCAIHKHPLQATAIGICVGGKLMSVLADTGATDCGIEEQLTHTLRGEIIHLRKPITFRYAHGQGKVTKAFRTEVSFGGQLKTVIDFKVFPSLACSILLGESFLRSSNAAIDYQRNTARISDLEIPLLNPSTQDGRVAATIAPTNLSKWEVTLQTMLKNSNLTGQRANELAALLTTYKDVFEEELENAGVARIEPVKLGLKPDYVHQWTRHKPLPAEEEDKLQNAVEKMAKRGQVEPVERTSTSKGCNSRVKMVEKKDGRIRITINLKRINDETFKDTNPLPNIERTTDDLAGAEEYFRLDFTSGFDQILLAEEDRPATAFSTAQKRYQLRTLPQGATNSPIIFQGIVEETIHGIPRVKNYIDDVLGACAGWEDLMKKLQLVLERIAAKNLKLKPSKCVFGVKRVEFLGYELSAEGKRPSPENTRAIVEMPAPTSPKEIESFLGFANYYRQFIKNFADLEAPLRAAAKEFKWTDTENRAFEGIKFAVTIAPTLTKISPKATLVINTDCSNKGMGATLNQRVNGKEFPVAFWSRMLSKAEKNYPTIKKELAAMYHAVKRFKPFVHMRDITIMTDHQPLLGFIKANNDELANPEATWVLTLAAPNINIQYKKGPENADADCLSRLPIVSMMVEVGSWETAQRLDPFIAGMLADIETKGVDYLDAEIIDGLLYKKMQNGRMALVVPQAMVLAVLEEGHGDKMGGHFGVEKTFAKISRYYAWPNMYKDIKNFVESCQVCVQKRQQRIQHGLPANLPIGSRPWSDVYLDLSVGHVKTYSGNVCRIHAIDDFTGYMEVRALPSHTAADIKKFILEEIVWKHGTPKSIMADNGKEFLSAAIKEVYEDLGIQDKHSTPYNPQGNGKVERCIGTYNSLQRMICEGNVKNKEWDTFVPLILWMYNTSPHETTGETPFYLNNLRDPVLPLQLHLPSTRDTDVATWKDFMRQHAAQARELARLNHEKSQIDRNIRIWETRDPTILDEGELVWLHVDQREGSTKFYWPWKGPYRVTAKLSDNTYQIRDIYNSDKVLPAVNIRRLKRYTDTLMINPTQDPARSESRQTSSNPPSSTPSAARPIETTTIVGPSPQPLAPWPASPVTTISQPIPTAQASERQLFQPEPSNHSETTTAHASAPNTPSKRPTPTTSLPQPNTPQLVKDGRKAVGIWMANNNLDKKTSASTFRTQFGPNIKSTSLAQKFQAVIGDKSLSDTDKRRQAADIATSSSPEDWNSIPEWALSEET